MPVGAAALIVALKILPKDRAAPASATQFDLPGALIVIGGLTATIHDELASASQWLQVAGTAAQFDNAASHLVVIGTAWQQVDQVWDLVTTESRLLQTPAMTEATDLVLRMGRLVWGNPQWTPARSDRAPRRTPAALAPGANALNSVVAAVHQAVDAALTRVAMADIQAVEAADRAGRLYVPTRSVAADYDVPRPFVPAPLDRFLALKDAYQAALNASMGAAQVLDELAVAARAPSVALALARAAASVQPPRRVDSRMAVSTSRRPPACLSRTAAHPPAKLGSWSGPSETEEFSTR